MNWLMRLLGRSSEEHVPEHIVAARAATAAAKAATDAAASAVAGYWKNVGREEAEQRLRLAKVDAGLGARRASLRKKGSR